MRLWLVIACVLLLAGCGGLAALAELQSQSDAAADALQKDLGVRPHMSWHYGTGGFTDVRVAFEDEKIENVTVGELESHVRAAITANFKEPPHTFIVSISHTK